MADDDVFGDLQSLLNGSGDDDDSDDDDDDDGGGLVSEIDPDVLAMMEM